MSLQNEAKAIAVANDSQFGLPGAIHTMNVVRAHGVATKLRGGIVWVNDYHRLDPASPGAAWAFLAPAAWYRVVRRALPDEERVKVGEAPSDRCRDMAGQKRLN